MLTFADIEQTVNAHCQKSAVKIHDAYKLKQYATWGGQETGYAWHTTGYCVYNSARSRLVLEVFYAPKQQLWVVRVFRETPLKVLFACKHSGDLGPLEQVLDKASVLFFNRLPTRPIKAEMGLEQRHFPVELARLLQPLPPPINWAKVQDV